MSSLQRLWLCILLLLAAPPATAARAQQASPLDVHLEPISIRPRSGALIPVNWTLYWHRNGLLRGRFHVVLRSGSKHLARITSEELLLAEDPRTFGMTLPAVISSNQVSDVTLDLSFTGERQFLGKKEPVAFDLEQHELRVPSVTSRSLTMCVCDFPSAMLSPRERRLLDSLDMNRFNPDPELRGLTMTPSYLAPDQFPSDALALCSFDVVMLTSDGFRRLGRKQTEALADWVGAGGSLCLLAGGQTQTHHREFLNRFSPGHAEGVPFLFDDDGRVQLGGNPRGGRNNVLQVRSGLGRVVLLAESPESDANAEGEFESPGWTRSVAFLWKIRSGQIDTIVRNKTWYRKTPEEAYKEAMESLSVSEQRMRETFLGATEITQQHIRLEPKALGVGDILLNKMMPEGVAVVPFHVIATILLVYVVTVGPLDYLVLGVFKRRRLTWILFPLVTIAFTVYTVRLAHSYLRSNEENKKLMILDLGEGNRILRHSRYDLFYSSVAQKNVSAREREIVSPLQFSRFTDPLYVHGNRVPGQANVPHDLVPFDRPISAPVYEGRLPLKYTVAQHVPQWTPHILRSFSIEPRPADVSFDWDAAEFPANDTLRKQLRAQISAAFGPDAWAVAFRGDQSELLSGGAPVFDPRKTRETIRTRWDRAAQITPEPLDFLQSICVRKQPGFFGVVSQISPTGGELFEDLTLLDPTDPDQWLLVVAREQGAEISVHRRLYSTPEP